MDEILAEFCKDSDEILNEVAPLLEALEDNPSDFKSLESYGQKIDRIMGAAQSLELKNMGPIAQFCKTISYKAAQSKNLELVSIVVAFLCDATETLVDLNESLKTTGTDSLSEVSREVIFSRLNFISNKLKDIQRASVAINDSGELEKMLSEFNMKK